MNPFSLLEKYKISFLLIIVNSIASSQNYFENVSTTTGFNPLHSVFENRLGMGQVFLDVNNDGNEDIFVTNQNGNNHLFINDGNGNFSENSQYDDLLLPLSHDFGATVTDYNNDGWQDIFIACFGGNKLMKNNNGQSFTDVTASVGGIGERFSIASSWADINQDGWLDLYVINYSIDNNPNEADQLFLNAGGNHFIDISADLNPLTNLSKYALAVQFVDYDNDGDQDLYVVNDKKNENTLWRNDGAATGTCGTYICFTDVSTITNTNRQVDGMGIAIADYDLDGDYDFYFSSSDEQVLLESQISQGSQSFIEKSNISGLNFTAVGWSTIFLDINNDMYPDSYLATMQSNTSQTDRLYVNNKNNTFNDVTNISGIDDNLPTIGAAKGDYNNDGRIDLVVGNFGNNFMLYKNVATDTNNWIKLKLEGSYPINSLAIGSKITVTTSSGKELISSIASGGSHGAGNSLVAHIGLGTDTITSTNILWSDGYLQQLSPMTLNNMHTISYPTMFKNDFE